MFSPPPSKLSMFTMFIIVTCSEDSDAWKLPRNLKELRRLNAVLTVYIQEHYWNVYLAYVTSYI